MFGGTKKDEDRYKGGGFKKVKVEEVEEKKWAPPPAIEKREKTWDEMTAEEKFNSQVSDICSSLSLPGNNNRRRHRPHYIFLHSIFLHLLAVSTSRIGRTLYRRLAFKFAFWLTPRLYRPPLISQIL